jgi:hypothetical protein
VGTDKRERQKANRALKQQEVARQQQRRKLTRRILIGVGAVAGVFLIAWIASNFVGGDDPVVPVPTEVEPAVEPTVEPTTEPTVETVPPTTGG